MGAMMGGKGGGKGGAMMGMMGMGAGDMTSLIKMSWQMAPTNLNYKQRSDAQQVQVKNLPPDATDFDLYKMCCPYGALLPDGVKAMLDTEGQCNGTGWVDFVKEEDAAACCQALN